MNSRETRGMLLGLIGVMIFSLTLPMTRIVVSELNPLLNGLGRLYLEKRDFPSAEKTFKAALELDHRNLMIWKNLSSTYYLSGNYPATIGTLDVIAKVEPPTAASWFIRALCYDKLHQLKPALEAYQKFLDLDAGKNPDQIWQAQQRSKVLKHQLEEKRPSQ